MTRKRSTKKPNIAMCTAFVLFCLVLISTHFTSGLYARYTTSDSANDSARVIKFGDLVITETGDFVDEQGNPKKAIITPGVDLYKNVTISFSGSESATYVFVKADLSKHWSGAGHYFGIGTGLIEWNVDSKWDLVEGTNYVYVIELKPNELLTEQPFIKDGLIKISSNLTEHYMNTELSSLQINLQAFVVQSNGFENAVKAWDSISK